MLHFQSQGLYRDIQFDFFEYEENMGDDKLRKVREYNQLFYNAGRKIFIFDADNPEIIEAHKGQEFVDWGNNVFSFIIPVPESRKKTPLISIEHYYSDDEIKTLDKNNRRLYINSEFDHETGILNSNSRIIKIKHSKDSELTENHIIDDEVFYVPEQIRICKENIYRVKTQCDNVSLSKNRFVEYIIKGEEPFRNFNLENFKLIFDIVSKIQYENMNGRLCDQEDSINYIEVSPIAHIRTFDNELKVLEICIPESEHTLQLRGMGYFGADIGILEEGIQILQDWGKGKIKIPLPLNVDLLDFLHDKAANHYNRIELQLYSDDGTRIIEILNGDIASGLIELKLQRFYT